MNGSADSYHNYVFRIFVNVNCSIVSYSVHILNVSVFFDAKCLFLHREVHSLYIFTCLFYTKVAFVSSLQADFKLLD